MVSAWVTDDGLRVSVRITPVQLAAIIYFTQSDTPVEDGNKDDHQQCLSIKVCYTLTVIDYA